MESNSTRLYPSTGPPSSSAGAATIAGSSRFSENASASGSGWNAGASNRRAGAWRSASTSQARIQAFSRPSGRSITPRCAGSVTSGQLMRTNSAACPASESAASPAVNGGAIGTVRRASQGTAITSAPTSAGREQRRARPWRATTRARARGPRARVRDRLVASVGTSPTEAQARPGTGARERHAQAMRARADGHVGARAQGLALPLENARAVQVDFDPAPPGRPQPIRARSRARARAPSHRKVHLRTAVRPRRRGPSSSIGPGASVPSGPAGPDACAGDARRGSQRDHCAQQQRCRHQRRGGRPPGAPRAAAPPSAAANAASTTAGPNNGSARTSHGGDASTGAQRSTASAIRPTSRAVPQRAARASSRITACSFPPEGHPVREVLVAQLPAELDQLLATGALPAQVLEGLGQRQRRRAGWRGA